MLKNENLKYMKHSFETIVGLFEEKAKITEGEVIHLEILMKYIKPKEPKQEKKEEKQFFKDVDNLKFALNNLKTKITTYIEDLKKIKKNRINRIEQNNNHLSLIPLLDCMQERSYSIAEKLEYINQAYENLIEPYTSLYLPMPIVSKRIKTSNIMLYFNKHLNDSYKKLKEKFYEITEYDKDNNEGVFSTWNFSTVDHVKSIDDSNRVFISLSFWFYEKQIFYPIAFHEIAHSLYYRLNESENTKKNIILSYEEKKNIKKEFFSNYGDSKKEKLDSAFIDILYQDIVADFSAYSLSGVSYIFALFYSTLFFNIHQNFYIDLAIKKIDKKISNKDKRCINQEENITILDWGMPNKTSNKFINSMYIRMSLLIKLSEKIDNKIDNKLKKELNSIKTILNVIYPKENNLNLTTFEDILTNFAKQNKQYLMNKNFTFMLLEEFEKIIFLDKKIHIKVKDVFESIDLFDIKDTDNKRLKEKYFNYIERFLNEREKDKIELPKVLKSQYDLYWYFKLNDCEHIGRMLRLHNLLELGIEPEKSLNDVIYELVYFKYNYNQNEKNPLLDFKAEEIFDDIFLKRNNKSYLGYALGPYDITLLAKMTTSKIDDELKKYIDKKTFFVDRHALFLLKEYEDKENNYDSIFDVIFSINIKGELQKEEIPIFFSEIKNIEDNIVSSCEKAQLFASMGNENFILYIYKFNIVKLKEIIYLLLDNNQVSKISTTLLINKFNKDVEIKESLEFDMLCKVRNNAKNYKINLDEVIKILEKGKYKNKINYYLKFGIYDISIKILDDNALNTILDITYEINNYVEDIQIEPSVNLKREGCRRIS